MATKKKTKADKPRAFTTTLSNFHITGVHWDAKAIDIGIEIARSVADIAKANAAAAKALETLAHRFGAADISPLVNIGGGEVALLKHGILVDKK